MIYCLIVFVLLLASFIAQEFVPIFAWAYYSRLLVVHAVFYSSAVSVPFPVMLILAVVSGFVWDCRYHLPVTAADNAGVEVAELPFGFSILIFGLLGTFIQGVRPFFRQGRWELPVLMVGACTLVGLLFEYAMISFHRGGVVTSTEFWWKILMTSLYSVLLAPFLLLLFSRIASLTGFKIQMDGITRRYSYDGDTF